MSYIDVFIEDDRTAEKDDDIIIKKETHAYHLNTECGRSTDMLAAFAKIMADAGYTHAGIMNAFKELGKLDDFVEIIDYCYPV